MLENNLPADVFYVPAYELYDHGNWEFDPDKIVNLKDKKLSIIDYSTENYNDTVPGVYEYFKELGINFILLTHNPEHHLTKPNILFYPYWYDWTRKHLTFRVLDQTAKRSHNIASLSRLPRTHRILNYILLRDKPYFDSKVITAHQEIENLDHITRPDDIILPLDIQSKWDAIRESLPVATTSQLSEAHNVTHPGYTDTYLHLTVETCATTGFFITEKTWQPIACGQLFLMWANAGAIAHLRDMGVDVFDDFIDHKYYDGEQDALTRLNKAHSVLDLLATQDLYKIFQDTLLRRESNISKFKNGEFGRQYRDQLNTCINMLN
jgi:hypothetical protein